MIKRKVNIAKNPKEAQEWDIRQAIQMSPEERQEVARQLKERVYGKKNPDVRAHHKRTGQ